MTPDIHSPFGHYSPHPFFRSLLAFAQNMPKNRFGERLAKLVRKPVMVWARLPVDLAVGSIKMRCYLRDNNSEKKFAFTPWCFDKSERELLLEVIPCNGTFVDIGANVGIYALTVATHLNSHGRIVALEPNPPAYQRLCFNLKATQSDFAEWPQIDALQLGVANKPCELELHLDPGNLGASSVAAHAASNVENPETVVRISCKPLDSILEELNIQRIDALKIDIEGAEDLALFPFLDEAPEAMLPHYIVIEKNEELWKLDLTGALTRRGYQVQLRTRMNLVYRRILNTEKSGADL